MVIELVKFNISSLIRFVDFPEVCLFHINVQYIVIKFKKINSFLEIPA